MAHISPASRRRAYRNRHAGRGLLAAPLLLFLAVTVLAAAYVAYVLWPRWPDVPVALDAPAIPITVGGVLFNIEPAAIRRPVQRRPGMQERVDLAYLWPSLTPPDPKAKPTVHAPIDPDDWLFVTIAAAGATLSPLERLKTIYPRYLGNQAMTDRGGLTWRPFADGTPYQGEDLVIEQAAPDHFLARCSRKGIGNSGICLDERRIGGADIILRFPREWLGDWQKVVAGLDKLVTRLHPDKP
jgi:hypothetical protein